MHFWNTQALAEELRNGRLTESGKLRYFLAWIALLLLGISGESQRNQPAAESLINAFTAMAFVMIGVWFCFCANARGDGKDFIGRFVCLSFPEAVKLALATLALALTYGGLADYAPIAMRNMIMGLAGCLLFAVFFWRVQRFIVYVSRKDSDPAS
jgi:hypothetical protein